MLLESFLLNCLHKKQSFECEKDSQKSFHISQQYSRHRQTLSATLTRFSILETISVVKPQDLRTWFRHSYLSCYSNRKSAPMITSFLQTNECLSSIDKSTTELKLVTLWLYTTSADRVLCNFRSVFEYVKQVEASFQGLSAEDFHTNCFKDVLNCVKHVFSEGSLNKRCILSILYNFLCFV